MSEPITLYTKDGDVIVLYAPGEARRMVSEGEAVEEKPEAPAAAPKTTRRKSAKSSEG